MDIKSAPSVDNCVDIKSAPSVDNCVDIKSAPSVDNCMDIKNAPSVHSCMDINECPFSGVTNSGRVWKKVPESKDWSALNRILAINSESDLLVV